MMMNFIRKNLYRLISDFAFFALFFLFFLIFNRYHLYYQEQIQLFSYNKFYLLSFFSGPGGPSELAGAFLTQFFLYPATGALILTFCAFLVRLLSRNIFRHPGPDEAVWAYIPVIILAGLHCSHIYTMSATTAMIFSLFFVLLYMKFRSGWILYALVFAGWPILYFVAGGYSLFAALLCSLFDALYGKDRLRFIRSTGFLVFSAAIPFFFSKTFFYMERGTEWSCLFPSSLNYPYKTLWIFSICYFPLIMIIKSLNARKEANFNHNAIIKKLAGFLIIAATCAVIYRYFYDRKTEVLLGMDKAVQNSDWKKVLDLSASSPASNRMTMYFTNLALCKAGLMGERLFSYPQSGSAGLWLDWQQDWVTAYFGGEIYYQLSYLSEARRWAFEAMVARGPNPRSLKRLVQVSLIDGNAMEAKKYLVKLHSTLFYRKWADKYMPCIDNPDLIQNDRELSEKKQFAVNSDYINTANIGMRIPALLAEHPENRMAFEYLMASLLLEKDLDGFEANIYRIKDLGYRKIPVLWEEALLACMSRSGKDLVPEGYAIGDLTRTRLNEYARAIYSGRNAAGSKSEEMNSRFGESYWYYLKFTENSRRQ